MISHSILVSSWTEWWVMKKEAATAAYKLMDILQMCRRDPEKTWLKDHLRHAEGPLGHPSHVSVSHIRNIPAISFVSPSFAVFPHCLFHPLNELQRQQAWGRGLQRNVRSCFGSRPVCTQVISTVWSLCFPREVLNPPPTPCALCKTHTYTQTDVI